MVSGEAKIVFDWPNGPFGEPKIVFGWPEDGARTMRRRASVAAAALAAERLSAKRVRKVQ
jgi:hypothetical protein